MEKGGELCARALSVSVSVPLVRTRENNFAATFLQFCARFFGTLWGLGLHGLLLIWYYAFRVEAMRYFHLGACQIPENNARFSAILLQHRRKKSSISSSKVFISLSPARE
jgi:hypothetical protein